MDRNNIIVCKNSKSCVIYYNGMKFIDSIEKYKDLSEEEIKDLFIEGGEIYWVNKRN